MTRDEAMRAFVQARLEDDERAAPATPDPDRALREVVAKRRILSRFEQEPDTLRGAVEDLTFVWLDHADYDPTWSI